jgi:hypothetical protein
MSCPSHAVIDKLSGARFSCAPFLHTIKNESRIVTFDYKHHPSNIVSRFHALRESTLGLQRRLKLQMQRSSALLLMRARARISLQHDEAIVQPADRLHAA